MHVNVISAALSFEWFISFFRVFFSWFICSRCCYIVFINWRSFLYVCRILKRELRINSTRRHPYFRPHIRIIKYQILNFSVISYEIHFELDSIQFFRYNSYSAHTDEYTANAMDFMQILYYYYYVNIRDFIKFISYAIHIWCYGLFFVVVI